MVNPFESIENRLSNLETLLLELKHCTLPDLVKESLNKEPKIVSLEKLIELRPVLGSKSTIYKKTYSGEIPHSKRGKRLFFDLEEIDAWMMENKVDRAKQIEEEVNNILSGE